MNRNENFCKGTQVSKIIARANVGARVVLLKKSSGVSRMPRMAICCVLGALLQDNNMLMGAFSLCIVTYLIDF